MRLNNDIRDFLRTEITNRVPEADLYLFGSRTDDQARGGDIDILILTKDPLDKKTLRTVRVDFYKKFGWQKLDLVSFTYDNQSAFRKLIQSDAISL